MRGEHRTEPVSSAGAEPLHLPGYVDDRAAGCVQLDFQRFHSLYSYLPAGPGPTTGTVGRVQGTSQPGQAQPTVLVSRQGDGNYMVKVRSGKVATSHVVSVPAGLAASLGAPGTSDERLVRASFTFLLEREPANAILPRFSLDVISRYFPEYPRELPKLLKGNT